MLNPTQVAQVKTEISKPEYNGMIPFQIFQKLTRPSEVVNPQPQPQVQKPYSLQEVYDLLSTAEKIAFTGTNLPFLDWAHQQLNTPGYTAQTEMLLLIGALLHSVVGDKKIPAVIAELINAQSKELLLALIKVLEVANLIGSETVAKLTDYANATIGDPKWKATVLTGPSFAQSIGAPMLSLPDVQDILNEFRRSH